MNTPLNTTSCVRHAATATGFALLIALAGCAHAPLRQATSEYDSGFIRELPAGFTAPIPVYGDTPVFPYYMRRQGIEGSAQIYCIVDENGRVSDVTSLGGSGSEFEFSARDAVRTWQFEPATHNGSPLAMALVIPFNFSFYPEERVFRM